MQNMSYSYNLDYGTQVTTSKVDEIVVNIDPAIMVGDYAKAYHNELSRRNPLKAKTVNLTVDELNYLFTAYIKLRIDQVNDEKHPWRQMKQMWIPSWIQFTLTQLGQVTDRARGLRFKPALEFEIDIDKVLDISERLSSFEIDGVGMVRDAFPRSIEGDRDTMMMAIIGEFVKGNNVTAHPITSYVTAFLGMKLANEQAFSMLYRVQYDDVDFIRQCLMRDPSIR